MEKDFEENKKGPFMSKAVFRPDETRRREEGYRIQIQPITHNPFKQNPL